MSSLLKVILATTVLTVLLLWANNHFVNQTAGRSHIIDLKTMAHVRDDTKTDEVVAVDTDLVGDGIKSPTRLTNLHAVQTAADKAANVDLADELGTKEEPEGEEDKDEEEDEGMEDATEVEEVEELQDATEVEDATELKKAAETQDSLDDTEDSGIDSKGEVEDADETDEEPEDDKQDVWARLGMDKEPPPPPTAAIDVMLEVPLDCAATGVALAAVTVKFRFDSPSIKGESLNTLETIVAEYRHCQGGRFLLTKNPLGKVDESPSLTQRRLDELKYFFIQHSVPKTALEYPEES